MARDFAKQGQSTRKRSGGQAGSTRKKTATRGKASAAPVSAWRWYGAGLLTGVFLSFLVYLGTLAVADADFWDGMLPVLEEWDESGEAV